MQSNFAGRRIGHPGERWHYALSAAAHASPHDAQEPVRVQSPIVIADKSNFSRTLPLRPLCGSPFSPLLPPFTATPSACFNNARTHMHLNVYICDRKISTTVAIALRLSLDFAPVTDCSRDSRVSIKSFLFCVYLITFACA